MRTKIIGLISDDWYISLPIEDAEYPGIFHAHKHIRTDCVQSHNPFRPIIILLRRQDGAHGDLVLSWPLVNINIYVPQGTPL